MKERLLNCYAAAAFNQCPHTLLPLMITEPIWIHISPEAKPVPAMTASMVPIHLREDVKRQLDEDVALGMLEKVPICTLTTWQARMHMVMKPDRSPRKTVNLRHLNVNCLREAEHIVAPYK